MIHEGGDCTVRYNFFDENGNPGFWITNNTDSIMYIDLTETFFVLNGTANDYFQARQWTSTKSSTISESRQERKNHRKKSKESMAGTSSTSSNSSSFSERPILMLPPRSTRYVSNFIINDIRIDVCGLKETPSKGKPSGTTFTVDNSPIVFANYLTYSVGQNGNKKRLSDQFFVSEIINVNGKAMFESYQPKDACGKDNGSKIERIRYSTPDRFYMKYKK